MSADPAIPAAPSAAPAAADRGRRKDLVGVVTSRSGDKTVKVTAAYKKPHPKYGKEIRRETTVLAHDEQNACALGDRVEIMETRPLSRLKRWRIVRVIEKAPQPLLANA